MMLYIHIPYCEGKCIYCDFYSGGNPDWDLFIKAIASELTDRIGEFRGENLSSVYIGGGTPSLMPSDKFEVLTRFIFSFLESHGVYFARDMEFTIEVNPEDVTVQRSLTWQKAGVNRLSMGVQSMVDSELKQLRRRHNSQRVEDSIHILKNHFNNISLDIIFGIPGQTRESLLYSLDRIFKFDPQHISVYSLTYEKGTPLWLLREKGLVKECDEEEFLIFNDLINSTLVEYGYERYEISNYSLSGFHSRHNSGYWIGQPYVGLGPSASSFNGVDKRRINASDLKSYLHSPSRGGFYEETLSEEERKVERIMIGLRLSKGIKLCHFSSEFGKNAEASLLSKALAWVGSGHMELKQGRLALTGKGMNISDHIILDLL